MRKKFLRELRKEMIRSNSFWEDDIEDMIHITNKVFKKCIKEYKEYKRKKNEKVFR